MALTTTEKLALLALGIDEAMLKGQGVAARTIKAIGRAAVKVSPYIARTAVPAAGRGVAALARRTPVGFGATLGLGALETPPGEALLEMAAERGAADRRALEQAIDERVFQVTRALESPEFESGVKSIAKRKVSKYSKAVKAGIKAVRQSKFDGKRGTIKNPKKTFSTVNKVVSAVNKGKKVATKGVRGTIARAARRVFK
jgi:hypothetical protein